jgi:hypothetical protein
MKKSEKLELPMLALRQPLPRLLVVFTGQQAFSRRLKHGQ